MLMAGTPRFRRGQGFMQEDPLYPIEQEFSLELPLGYPAASSPPSSAIAVVLHAFHADLLDEFRGYLQNIPFGADLFVSTDTEEKSKLAMACFAGWRQGAVKVRVVPNRGRDVAPKVVGFADVHHCYEYVVHLHTKQSSHDSRLAGWRGYLLETLLGSPETVRGIFEAFARAPRLGILAPQHIDELRPWIRWGQNYAQAEALATRMGFSLPRLAPLDFPSGSMFWARSAALQPLLDLQLGFSDFPAEAGQTDGTIAHAIERLYFIVCEQAGFDWFKISARGELHDQRCVNAVSSPGELVRFLTQRQIRLTRSRKHTRPIEDHPVIMSPPPKPRRVLHVLWRAALGDAAPWQPGHRLAIVLHGAGAGSRFLARSAQLAIDGLPPGLSGQVVLLSMPNCAAGDASSTDRNSALESGFAIGADLVLLLDKPGNRPAAYVASA